MRSSLSSCHSAVCLYDLEQGLEDSLEDGLEDRGRQIDSKPTARGKEQEYEEGKDARGTGNTERTPLHCRFRVRK